MHFAHIYCKSNRKFPRKYAFEPSGYPCYPVEQENENYNPSHNRHFFCRLQNRVTQWLHVYNLGSQRSFGTMLTIENKIDGLHLELKHKFLLVIMWYVNSFPWWIILFVIVALWLLNRYTPYVKISDDMEIKCVWMQCNDCAERPQNSTCC